jgi:hypothetical protein
MTKFFRTIYDKCRRRGVSPLYQPDARARGPAASCVSHGQHPSLARRVSVRFSVPASLRLLFG